MRPLTIRLPDDRRAELERRGREIDRSISWQLARARTPAEIFDALEAAELSPRAAARVFAALELERVPS